MMLKIIAFVKWTLILVVFGTLFSCTYKEKIIYFRGDLSASETNKNYNPVLKSDDIISVAVIGLDEQASKPFNLPLSGLSQSSGGYILGTPSPPGYLIDYEGNIDFPVIGKIKLGGLSRSDAID